MAEDEAQRILKEVKIAIDHVKESKFYAKLTEQINSNEFQCQLKKVMGESYSQVNMVIYALGSLEFGFNPIFQLAIALLIKQDFSSWIGGKIEVYDPIFSPADVIVLKELGCEVLLINEECRRQAEKPTLFYMPYAVYILVDNLLWANWCPSRINQLILLTRSFKISHNLTGKNPKTQFSGVSENYMDAIQDHTKEILIEESYGNKVDNIFYNFAFHFFEINSQLDMENLIPDENWKLMKQRLQLQRNCDMTEPIDYLWKHKCSEEFSTKPFAKDAPKENWAFTYKTYPCPRKYRCSRNPPPEGWIKLNFGGSRRSLAKIWQVLVAFVTMSLKHLYLFTMVMVLLAMWIKLWHLLNH